MTEIWKEANIALVFKVFPRNFRLVLVLPSNFRLIFMLNDYKLLTTLLAE